MAVIYRLLWSLRFLKRIAAAVLEELNISPANIDSLQKLPIKEKNPTFIFVSRLVKMKGIEDVIIAFSKIITKLPNSKLWIVGGGDETYVLLLKDKVKKLNLDNKIIFYGRVTSDKKIQFMRSAHILLHASVKSALT